MYSTPITNRTHKGRSCLSPSRTAGFTLIELLVVIVVIGILAALLVPAVGGAIRRSRVASVRMEISKLETSIAKFKIDHSIDPPSSIFLFESAADWVPGTTTMSLPTGYPGTLTDLINRNVGLVRQIWPNYDFADHDIDGDGTVRLASAGGRFQLDKGECLVFFLGGMPQLSG